MIYPIPQKITQTGSVKAENFSVSIVAGACAASNEWLAMRGFAAAAQGDIRISLILDDSRRFSYIEESRCVTNEKYLLTAAQAEGYIEVSIRAAGEPGFWHGLNTLAQQMENGELLLGEIEDYPLFAARGYIEGFYGEPWKPAQRLSVIDLMAKNKMNTYYHAPKDDPYHRDLWQELYPAQELADLTEFVAAAQKQYVTFYYCIAPGLSMRYASEEDYQSLFAKLMQLYDIGVRHFGLLLDDIPHDLQFEEDIARFGSETVTAHIYLGNRLLDDLKAHDRNIQMTLCPLQYHGKGDEYFISKLGQGLDAEISLFWTGHNICSQELTSPEAMTFIRATRHKPLYWDNFPVNDAEMYQEMHLGYLNGRDADLYRYSDGLISNCMEFCECSKIPLLTVADYLWNPPAYDGMASWERALHVIAGDVYDDFRILADHLLTSCLKVENSPYMNKCLGGAAQAVRIGNPLDALGALGEYTERVGRCCALLRTDKRPLFAELTRWAKKLEAAYEVLQNGLALLGDSDAETAQKLKDSLAYYMRQPEVLTEFSLQSAAEELLRIAGY